MIGSVVGVRTAGRAVSGSEAALAPASVPTRSRTSAARFRAYVSASPTMRAACSLAVPAVPLTAAPAVSTAPLTACRTFPPSSGPLAGPP